MRDTMIVRKEIWQGSCTCHGISVSFRICTYWAIVKSRTQDTMIVRKLRSACFWREVWQLPHKVQNGSFQHYVRMESGRPVTTFDFRCRCYIPGHFSKVLTPYTDNQFSFRVIDLYDFLMNYWKTSLPSCSYACLPWIHAEFGGTEANVWTSAWWGAGKIRST